MVSGARSSAGPRPAGGTSPATGSRHGFCAECGRTFRLEGGEVPPGGLVLDCPGCGAPMPLSASPRRKRAYRIVSRPATRPESREPTAASPPAARASVRPFGDGPATIPVRRTDQPAARRRAAIRVHHPPRWRGWLSPVAGLLLGIYGGAGLLAFLASRSGALNRETVLGLPIWAKAVAVALPAVGLLLGLLLRRRR